MKLNKISNAFLTHKAISLSKSTIYTTALLTALTAPNAIAAEEEAAAEEDVEVIQVTGMRGTMTRSLNEKKYNTAIVDAIAAADFGELPGLSISDIIENVSGATGHRLKGSQNEISIRGLGSYWGYATFNGRTVTNAGEGRAVNFKKFPSELVDKVVVYKSQQADLVEGGTSGTIEVASLRPVDHGKSQTTVELSGIYNDYYGDVEGDVSPWGGKLVLSTVNQWETDNLGAMGFTFGVSHTESSNPEENYNSSSQLYACALRNADGSLIQSNRSSGSKIVSDECDDSGMRVSEGDIDNNAAAGIDLSDPEYMAQFDQKSIFFTPSSSLWRTGEDEDTRSNIVATFQWVPNDQWDINVDAQLSRLEYTEKRMEFQLDNLRFMTKDHIIRDDHSLAYVKGAAKPQLASDWRNQTDDYEGFGVNIEFNPSDDLTLTADFGYSHSERYRVSHRSKYRSEDRYFYELDYRDTNVPNLNFIDADTYDFDANDEYVYGAQALTEVNTGVFDPTDINSFIHTDKGYEFERDAQGNHILDADGNWIPTASSGGSEVSIFDQTYMEYKREHDHRDNENISFSFDAEYVLDSNIFSSIKAGIRVSSETLTDDEDTTVSIGLNGGAQVNDKTDTDDHYINGYNTSNDDWDKYFAHENAQLTAYVKDTCLNGHQNNRLFDQENAGDAASFATYDAQCMIGAFNAYATGKAASGDFSFSDIGERTDPRSGQDVDVQEDTFSAYFMANINTEIADIPVSGNIGLRVVRTDTSADGWADTVVVTDNTEADALYKYSSAISSEFEAINRTGSYTEALPSLNLTFALSDEFLFRTSIYKSLSRFSLQSMAAGNSYYVCVPPSSDDAGDDEENNSTSGCESDELNGTVGSAKAHGNQMKPFTAVNYDISLEYYPSEDAAVTLALYQKDFQGGWESIVQQREAFVTYNGVQTSVGLKPFATIEISDEKSTIRGMELTAQKHFSELPGIFSGLGVKAGYNWADSSFVTPEEANMGLAPDANLFGFSKNVANASVYWEGDAVTLRLLYKHRSKYFQPNNLPFPDRSNRFVQDQNYVDFSAKYKISKSVSVSLKALNLLDEPQVQTRAGDSIVTDYSRSGTKYFVGVKAKF
ncbi:TonB-dependent receptor [Algibacillus agarilyticus]|uniref:TonB-dependent receptor n=1 Tax=Algibacillus agarilyticus TaxID=2234133 RepID=UPI000DCFEA67|nr:TonB-dependent receptor [Algibacillus agarilyticus]